MIAEPLERRFENAAREIFHGARAGSLRGVVSQADSTRADILLSEADLGTRTMCMNVPKHELAQLLGKEKISAGLSFEILGNYSASESLCP